MTKNRALIILFLAMPLMGPAVAVLGSRPAETRSSVSVATVHSENERFYLTTVPYDAEFPTVRGKTSVYRSGEAEPVYVFAMGFTVDQDNTLILSNDGETVLYAIPRGSHEGVTIYRRGRPLTSYTSADIDGCDAMKERCSLLYSNFDTVVDKAASRWGTRDYKKTLKPDVDAKERFLSDFPIFSSGDTVYLTDSKRRVHIFDLKEGALVRSDDFDKLYTQLQGKGRFEQVELQHLKAPSFRWFPKLANGKAAGESLADFIGMKPVDFYGEERNEFKWYSVTVNANILRDGSLEIENLDAPPNLPVDRIREFFRTNRFDRSSVPDVFEKWNLGDKYFFFRKGDEQLARMEKKEEATRQAKEYDARLVAERINGVYIPKNLGECFAELDKLVPEIDRNEMRALPSRDGMVAYHLGLGMSLRNTWGLWGGSRLQKYFADRGLTQPDDMSGVILTYYYDWLHGMKETWKDWEKTHGTNE